MLLHLPAREDSEFDVGVFDQQLMVIRRKESRQPGHPWFVFEAVIPIAVPVIREKWPGLQYLADINDSMRYVFSSPIFTNPVKSKAVETYIIEKLRYILKKKKEKVTLEVSTYSGEELSFPLTTVVDFSGQGALDDSLFQRDECSLFVPSSQTYPNVDFFIWKPAESKKSVGELHAFQVTLGSVNDHFHTQTKFMALEGKPETKFLRKETRYTARYHFVVPLAEAPKTKPEEAKKRPVSTRGQEPETSLVILETLSSIDYFYTLGRLHVD